MRIFAVTVKSARAKRVTEPCCGREPVDVPDRALGRCIYLAEIAEAIMPELGYGPGAAKGNDEPSPGRTCATSSRRRVLVRWEG
jgi:hypothetical protein